MSQSSTLSVGLDVHTESIAVASVAQDHDADVFSLGTIGTRQADIDQRVRTLHAKAKHLVFVYEAGSCGSWLSRDLTTKGHPCWGVAPALMPNKAGARVHTDRRDAIHRARLRRAGARTRVDVPAVADDASRDRRRARDEALADRQAATCRRHALVLRHARRSTGRAPWGPVHRRWLAEGGGATPAHHRVCQAAVRAVHAPPARRPRLGDARQEQGQAWRLQPGGEALEARRGVPCPGAVTRVAERGALTRVAHLRPLLTARGLSPSASARGARHRQGSLPNAGNPHARRALVAGAWAYREPATGSRPLHRRRAPQPTPIPDLSGKAHGRRCPRARRLRARGTPAHQVVGAMARELAGGWAWTSVSRTQEAVQKPVSHFRPATA
jgi:transposase